MLVEWTYINIVKWTSSQGYYTAYIFTRASRFRKKASKKNCLHHLFFIVLNIAIY